jgi:hypothetical protein
MAERNDAGIAEDQVERQREQGGDRDLACEHKIGRCYDEGQQRRKPEHDLDHAPARLVGDIIVRSHGRRGHYRHR